MSQKQLHKKWRKEFNEGCLKRDGNKCVICGDGVSDLDVHHITDRHLMPNGGYAISNGITVCEVHHLDCEAEHMEQEVKDGFYSGDLYKLIGSSYEQAYDDCLRLN